MRGWVGLVCVLTACRSGADRGATSAASPSSTAASAAPRAGSTALPPASGPRCVLSDALLPDRLTLVPSGASLYVSDGATVRRYTRAPGPGCALTRDATFADGGTLRPPPTNDQLRPDAYWWRIAAGVGDAVYYFNGGRSLFRIDRGGAEFVCSVSPFVATLAAVRGTLYTSEAMPLLVGETCTQRVRASHGSWVYAAGDELYARLDLEHLARLDDAGEIVARFGGTERHAHEPGGLCAVGGVVACGGAVCVLDTNCSRISRFTRDGVFLGEARHEVLLGETDVHPEAIAASPDGVWLAGSVRGGAGRDPRVGAVFWLSSEAITAAAVTAR